LPVFCGSGWTGTALGCFKKAVRLV
jgi:hypothetical protein